VDGVSSGRDARVSSPADAIDLGVALVPEDRKRQGLVLSESGRRNTSLPLLDRLSRLTWLKQSEERALVERYFHMLRIRAPDIDAPVAGLSGGNQQKIVLARWLAANAKILILDEPTRGVDVGAKAEIHALIGESAKGAVLLIGRASRTPSACRHGFSPREPADSSEKCRQRRDANGLLRLMAGIG
jgi:ABC-type sugar transport system ATPase subunit